MVCCDESVPSIVHGGLNMDVELLSLILLLSAVAMYQFFRGRKLNLMMMSKVSKGLETALKPTDKEYAWLGGYVGFRANYSLEHGEVEATLTLLPRQALLYLPVSLLVNRSDRLYLVFRGRIALEEIHIFGKRRMLRRGERRELKGLKLEKMGGFGFSGDSTEASELIERLSLDSRTLFHLYAKEDHIFILMDPKGRIDLSGVLSLLSL